MLIIRKIGKTLRGQAKPYQIIAAALLGALIGFAPPLGNAPLYLIGVVLLLAVLNANFFIATVTAGLCKLAALALMPVSFEIGLVLVDGPLQPLMRTLINAPVTALMGFDYYVTTGGIVLALILGGALGFSYLKIIANFRKMMAKVEADSEKYADWVSKRSVRILMWILFGGKAKMTYAELTEQKKIGNPIRPLGVAFAVLVVVLLVVVQQFASAPLITTLLRGQLEQFHGATVDLDGVDLDLASGKLTVDRLAMADPDNLELDLIRAEQVVAKVSTTDLLRKRITIDQILVDDAVQGEKRDRPGVLIGKRPAPPEPTGEGKSLEDWFEQAKGWKERLEMYYDWYKKLKGPPEQKQAKDPSVKDRLRDWADRYGHASVRAAHLVEGSPAVLVKEVQINKLRANWPDEETLDIHATNLSTHPALVDEPPRVTVKSSGQTFDMNLALAPAARIDQQSELKLTLRNQSVDETMADLRLIDEIRLNGGTWQAGIDGAWSDNEGLDLPLIFAIQDTNLMIAGLEPTPIDRFPVEFAVTGSIGSPSLTADPKKLWQSIQDNGGNAVLAQLTSKGTDLVKEALGDNAEGIGNLIDGVLGGQEDENKPSDEDDDSESDAGDLIRRGFEGLRNRDND